jgi:hypothetical protein
MYGRPDPSDSGEVTRGLWVQEVSDRFVRYTTGWLINSLNESSPDKIRKHRPDYRNNPPDTVSFMTVITRTSGRLHSEFVRLLFLQDHRETDRFFTVLGVHLV